MKTNLMATCVLATLGSLATDATADVVIRLDETTFAAGTFSLIFEPGRLMGTLTGVTLCNFSCDAAPQVQTFAVYLLEGPLPPAASLGQPFTPPLGGRLQVGGTIPVGVHDPLDLGADEWGAWADPSNPGFFINDSYVVSGGGFDVSSYALLLGNGVEPVPGVAIPRTYTGTITLAGVELVPAPGAIALLAISGLVGASRRRR